MRIDAHHHLWTYKPDEFGWIDEKMHSLRQDFGISELASAMHSAGVESSIVVQARQSLEETQWLLSVAENSSLISAVVGWAPLSSNDLQPLLESWTSHPKLCGLRHIVQSEQDGFMDQPGFRLGMSLLRDFNLTYDVLICQSQMPEAIRLVDRYPQQRFVLDHMGKPLIADGILEPWRTNLQELARRDNVWCKFSGMVTEAKWDAWQDTLKPFADVVVQAFGPNRIMAGSDWPVCLVASDYARWWQWMENYFAAFSNAEKWQIFGGTAAGFYGVSI